MSRDDSPLVSVLMTAYNREKYIGQAIESVLASSYTNFELIIVDDGSRDDTVKIASVYAEKDPRIRIYVNEKNLGDYPNRNKAASYANGKYLKYLDSDDLIYPHGLAVFVKSMEMFPGAAIGLSSQSVQEDNPYPVFFTSPDAYRTHFFKRGILDTGPTGVIIRTDIFRLMGGFSGKTMIGDFELWLKISALHPVVLIAPGLIFWRIHEGQQFFKGIEDGIYLNMKLGVISNAFLSAACPLTKEESRIVMKHYKRLSAMGLLHLIKKGEYKKAKSIQADLKLKFSDFFSALFFKKRFIL
ncbi:MAG TPA: glycosyltransferase family 2 protein [Puia sp.]|nr:glycosyltransferase family 2 protein [Puia sp.]